MAPSSDSEVPLLQALETKVGEPHRQLPAQICSETGDWCIFWQDVQNAFPGVDFVGEILRSGENRVLFMVGQDGDVIRPLRIRCLDLKVYRVIYLPQGQLPPTLEFECLYHTWFTASKNEEKSAKREERSVFLEISGNAGYHHSKLQDQLQLMMGIGVRAEVDGKTEEQILAELQEYRQKCPVWDYQNSGINVLLRENFLAPSRFLVLPADLRSWVDSDPTTHNFRLYFLCDIIKDDSEDALPSTLPENKHLSNHPGYNLIRPQEFFQVYGGYTLVMLKMAKQGFVFDNSEFLTLDTFGILWDLEADVTSSHVIRDTIGLLIDKSIDYLQKLPMPRCGDVEWLKGRASAAIKDFLDVPKDSNPLGGLYRCTNAGDTRHWICKKHKQQWLLPGTQEALMDFVQGCGGQVDIQRASLGITLQSREQVDKLCTLLKNTNQQMEVSINIDWHATRRDLQGLLQKIADTKVCHLELNGVTLGMHPQGSLERRTDIFIEPISPISVSLRSVTLLNYPRPQEQYTYLCSGWAHSVYRLHWKQQKPMETGHWWGDLERVTSDFVGAIVVDKKGQLKALRQLQDLLAKLGCQDVRTVGNLRSNWRGELDLKEGKLWELQVYDLSAMEMVHNDEHRAILETPVPLELLESLRQFTVDVEYPNIAKDVELWVQASLQLQELNISLQESRALEFVKRILEIWQGRSHPLQLTLLERESDGRASDGRGRIVTQLVVSSQVCSRLRSGTPAVENSITRSADLQEQGRGALPADFLQWSCDHVSILMTDLTVALLDIATETSPSTMTSLSLDVSDLSRDGLFHIQNILQRSTLERLHICCTLLNPSLVNSVRQALLSTQWPTLQSLVLTGTAVNEWIQILEETKGERTNLGATLSDLHLQHLGIYGTGAKQILLTHSSMLFIHRLGFANPQMELVLENACLENIGDLNQLDECLRSG
ncbi:MAG: hypothetical protein BYD32DRAFT_118620 [Podila humilis]|nr:MAG: hypothetical protein BYD32DRAFT_118620 [Podila humilis]